MARTATSLQRAALGLVIVTLMTVGAVVSCALAVRRASEHGEDALVALTDDITRASQAQAAAERMIAVGRAYLLTQEPDLLARAQAADAKLARTLETIVSSAPVGDERQRLEPLLGSAKRYGDTFAALLSGEKAPHQPREIAHALRQQLIPTRDELIAGLDALASRRLMEAGALRISARARRAVAVDLMLVLGLSGAAASIFFVWRLLVCARAPAAERGAPIGSPVRSSSSGHSGPSHRLRVQSPIA